MSFSTSMPGLLVRNICVSPLTSPLTGGLERIETPQIIAMCDNGQSDVRRSSVVISAMANNHAL